MVNIQVARSLAATMETLRAHRTGCRNRDCLGSGHPFDANIGTFDRTADYGFDPYDAGDPAKRAVPAHRAEGEIEG